MPAKISVENNQVDFDADLGEALSFAVNNTGEVDCFVRFDQTGSEALIPASSSVNFDFIGDRYSGKIYGRFDATAAAGARRNITIIKTLFFCK